MPTVVRGGRRQSGPPAARGQGAKRAAPKRGASKGKPQQALKLHALSGVNLSPAAAITLAILVLSAGGVMAFAASGGAAARGLTGVLDQTLAGWGVKLVHIRLKGASASAIPAIRQALSLSEGEPMAGMDLNAVKTRIETVGWVKSARVTRQLPDTLAIEVVERKPVAVWQNDGKALVVDDEGHGIPEAEPMSYSTLPLVMGDGAGETAAQILPQIASRPRLASRVDALVRVDGRRWDVRLKDGGIISLPATDEAAALITLDQLDQRDRILELDLERVDLRSPDRVTVRPRGGGVLKNSVPATAPAHSQ